MTRPEDIREIIAHLRRAIDATERIAQAAKSRAPRPWIATFKQVTEGPIGDMTIVAATDWSAVSHHIAANDPDAALLRCAAARLILDEIVDEANGLDLSVDLDRRVGERDEVAEPMLGNRLVCILAEMYSVKTQPDTPTSPNVDA